MTRLFSVLLLLFAVGCSSSTPPCAPQRCRPQIAVLPVINGTNTSLPWNVEKELTDDILDSLMCGGSFWLSPFNQFQAALDQTKGRDLFGADLSFANHFSHNDFLVIVELVGHDVKPYDRYEYPELPSPRHLSDKLRVLDVAARVRVLDLRYEEPVIVRQEMVEKSMLMTARDSDRSQGSAGQAMAVCPEYMGTPFDKSNKELAGIISDKVGEAIFCSW